MELDMEDAFNTGTPLRCIPACIVSSLRDFSFVLFHKTFWAAPRDNK